MVWFQLNYFLYMVRFFSHMTKSFSFTQVLLTILCYWFVAKSYICLFFVLCCIFAMISFTSYSKHPFYVIFLKLCRILQSACIFFKHVLGTRLFTFSQLACCVVLVYECTLTVAPGKKSQLEVSGGSKLSSIRGALWAELTSSTLSKPQQDS